MTDTKVCTNSNCPHNGEPQPLDNFRTTKGGKCRSHCKDCEAEYQRQYRKTNAGRAVYNKYNNSEAGKESIRRYDQSEHGKIKRGQYRQDHIEWYMEYWRKRNRSVAGKRSSKRYANSESGKLVIAGMLAVRNAVSSGVLPPISECLCIDCGCQATAYHHHNGYDAEHITDVVPVCHKCHKIRHSPTCPLAARMP